MCRIITILLLCQHGLFVYKCVSKNANASKDTIFYLLWYNVVRWSSNIYKKASFLSFHSLLFLVNNAMRGQIKIEKVWHRLMEWKMPLYKWHTFWMAPWLICCLTVILLHIQRKWHLYPQSYPWNLICLDSFSVLMLLMEVSKC